MGNGACEGGHTVMTCGSFRGQEEVQESYCSFDAGRKSRSRAVVAPRASAEGSWPTLKRPSGDGMAGKRREDLGRSRMGAREIMIPSRMRRTGLGRTANPI